MEWNPCIDLTIYDTNSTNLANIQETIAYMYPMKLIEIEFASRVSDCEESSIQEKESFTSLNRRVELIYQENIKTIQSTLFLLYLNYINHLKSSR